MKVVAVFFSHNVFGVPQRVLSLVATFLALSQLSHHFLIATLGRYFGCLWFLIFCNTGVDLCRGGRRNEGCSARKEEYKKFSKKELF
jgi:hypothetical protein